MEKQKSLLVVLYARVSTRDKGQDTENQLQQLREFCQKQDWHITQEYIDHASGKRTDRPKFQQMLADASQRKFDLLVFWSLDRLTREGALATLRYLEQLGSYGVRFRSYTEPYLDTLGAFGEAIIAVLGCIAKQERQRISERVLAGLQRARKEGRIGGRPRVVVNRDAVRRARQKGATYAALAKQFGISPMTACNIARDGA